MKTKNIIIVMAVLVSIFCLTISVEACRNPQVVQPDQSSHTGLLVSICNPTICDRLTMMRLGEMRTIQNPDGSWTSVFVAMHFMSYTFFSIHLGVSSLRMDSFDKVHLVGTVIQNGISYPVTGTYYNCCGWLGFSLSWNGACYGMVLVPNT
jgi:hypothetical protein